MPSNGFDNETRREGVLFVIKPLLIPFLVFLTIEIVFTCVHIELLNQRAGGILPRELPKQGNPKWHAWNQPEKFFTKWYADEYRETNHLAMDAQLPKQVVEDIATRAKAKAELCYAENELRGACGSLGLLQYPAAFTVSLLGLVMGLRKPRNLRRKFCLCCGFIGVACLGIAFYRSYFGSLGW